MRFGSVQSHVPAVVVNARLRLTTSVRERKGFDHGHDDRLQAEASCEIQPQVILPRRVVVKDLDASVAEQSSKLIHRSQITHFVVEISCFSHHSGYSLIGFGSNVFISMFPLMMYLLCPVSRTCSRPLIQMVSQAFGRPTKWQKAIFSCGIRLPLRVYLITLLRRRPISLRLFESQALVAAVVLHVSHSSRSMAHERTQ